MENIKKTKAIKGDREILKGIRTGNARLLNKLRHKGWELNKMKFRGSDPQDKVKSLMGPHASSSLFEGKSINVYNKKSLLGKGFHKVTGLHPDIALRHELMEAKHIEKVPEIKFHISKKLFGTSMPKAMHAHPDIITRESNLMRGLSGKYKNRFMKIRNKAESPVIKSITGKQYGKDYLSNADASKVLKSKGNTFGKLEY